MLEQIVPAERSEVSLRVPDVDGEQHRATIMLGIAMATARPKLYVLPGSHPCAAVEAALKLKSIDYQRVDLLPMSQVLIGPLRYGGNTVPGMRLDGERLVGSRRIMRRLDQLVPAPPLLPRSRAPPTRSVLEAERWGDEVLQSVPRRIIDVAFDAPAGGDGELRRRRQAAAAGGTDAPRPAADRSADGAQEQGA